MLPAPCPRLRFRHILLPCFFTLFIAVRLAAAALVWDLPAQPLADALMTLSAKSGYQVLFSSTELAGVKSRPVQGEYEPLDALHLLLGDTPFEAVPTGEKHVVVRARPLSLISGIVHNARSNEPVAGATVSLEGTKFSTVTAKSGRFQLTRIPAGKYTVIISAEGLQTTRVEELTLEAGSRVELKPVALEETPSTTKELNGFDGVSSSSPLVMLESMVVTPSHFGVSESPAVPNATLTHEDLEVLPQLGEDLYRAIGRLPGLATMDLSSKFWVRGAPNDQVLARLDGFTLLEPYHIKDADGALAIIDIETVAKLDLLSGGFTTEYGDRLAGVLQMETATHAASKSHSTLGLSLTGMRATNRGTFAEGKGSWMISGRMGYPDIALDMANETADEGGETLIRYYDIFAKIEYQPIPGQIFGLHILKADDSLTIKEPMGRNLDSSYGNDHIWARWRGEFPASGLKGETVLGYSALDWNRSGAGLIGQDREPFQLSDKRDLALTTLRSDWSLPAGERSLFRSGFELQNGSADYRYHRVRVTRTVSNGVLVNTANVFDLNPDPEGMNNGAYVAWRFRSIQRLTLEPGVRYDWSDYGPSDGGWSPRLNAAYDLGKSTTLRAAWGRYRQQQGLHEIDVMDGDSSIYPAERAEHRVVGIETVFAKKVAVRAEVYQRITENPRPHGENLIEKTDILGELLSDRVYLRPTQAEARGFELTVENRRHGRLDWLASYALADTVETLDGREAPRDRDQQQTFQTDLFFRPNPRWQFTASWQYHTGWPATAKYYSNVPLNNGQQAVVTSYGPVNGERLPAYHRLDLRATRVFTLKHSTLRAFVDIFNAYDRENVVNYNTSYQGSGAQLTTHQSAEALFPILPSVGLIWDF